MAVIVVLIGAGIFKFYLKVADMSAEELDRYINEEFLEYTSTPGNSLELIAEKFHEIRLKYYSFVGNYEKETEMYNNLIRFYENRRRVFQLAGIDSDERSEWFADTLSVYKNAVLLNLDEKVGNISEAFILSELCRGRTLIDHYSDILVSRNYLLLEKELEELKNYHLEMEACALKIKNNEDLANSQAQYLQLKKEEQVYKMKLREKYSNLMIPKDEKKQFERDEVLNDFWDNFDIEKNCRNIPANAFLIEFMKISDNLLLVFAVHSDSSIKAVKILTDKKFYENLQLYHELNAYPDINALHRDGKYFWSMADGTYKISVGRNSPNSSATAVNDNAKWLELRQTLSVEISRKILQPVEQFIDNETHWIISPDAELNLIPFETLIYHDKMLVESVNVCYVPSLAVLNMMKHRERKNVYLGVDKDLFAMGNAVYGDNTKETSRGSQADFFNSLRGNNDDDFVDMKSLRWNNLPGTDKEVDKVAALFESKDIFKQNDASEKNLKEMNEKGELAQYKYLLFSTHATHGLFVPTKPELSSIVLSQETDDEDNDGYVTITEWMGYELRSNLVYLSACETGLGGYQDGEGIMGIPYALTLAGNKDTVMSLWKVDDDATAEFTAAVFEKIKDGKTEVAALNETKREFLKKNNSKYSNPSIWSAFVLYGI